MAELNLKTIEELTKLCRIECTPEEQEKYLHDLESIFAYFTQLQEIDTEGVKPLNHVLESIQNVEREDVVGDVLPREVFLGNVPKSIGGFVQVPLVIKGGA